LMKEGTIFMVVHAEINYKSPARYGETLTIETTLDASKNASFTFVHTIREKMSGRVIVEGSATLVPTGSDGKLKRLATGLKQVLLTPPKGER
jgi:acyl-CoA thioester hydrolase